MAEGATQSRIAMPKETQDHRAPDQFLAEWGGTLEDIERNLRAALQAVEALRGGLEAGAPPRFQVVPPPPAAPASEPAPEPIAGGGSAAHSPFERLWDRLEQERVEKQAPAQVEERRGLDLLPRSYLMTVEDKDTTVDLVPLHRALLSVMGVQEIALVSFANGVPVVSMRTDREVDLDQLGRAVSSAMDRECEVIQQDNGRLFLRLKPVADREASRA
jgi:hypothetical protein